MNAVRFFRKVYEGDLGRLATPAGQRDLARYECLAVATGLRVADPEGLATLALSVRNRDLSTAPDHPRILRALAEVDR